MPTGSSASTWSAALLARGVEVRRPGPPGRELEALGWPPSVEVFRAYLPLSARTQARFQEIEGCSSLGGGASGGEDAPNRRSRGWHRTLLDDMDAGLQSADVVQRLLGR